MFTLKGKSERNSMNDFSETNPYTPLVFNSLEVNEQNFCSNLLNRLIVFTQASFHYSSIESLHLFREIVNSSRSSQGSFFFLPSFSFKTKCNLKFQIKKIKTKRRKKKRKKIRKRKKTKRKKRRKKKIDQKCLKLTLNFSSIVI